MTPASCVAPGETFTIPSTRSHAVIRSSSPSSRRRLPSIARPTSRAAAAPCAIDNASPTFPRGSASVPSGCSGRWPETYARLSLTRTQENGYAAPVGERNGSGKTSPNSRTRSSIVIGPVSLHTASWDGCPAGRDDNPVPRSPLPIRRENVIFCLCNCMAREPALGVVLLRRIVSLGGGRESVGCGVIVKLGPSPSAGVRKIFGYPSP